jgi:hypothetical protein
VLVGTFLDWASGTVIDATGTQTETVDLSGLNVPDGRIVMGIGLALLVMAALMWANTKVGSWFDADLLGVTLSTIAIGTIVAFLIDVGDTGRSVEIGTYVSLKQAVLGIQKTKDTASRLANGEYPEDADHIRVLAGMISTTGRTGRAAGRRRSTG